MESNNSDSLALVPTSQPTYHLPEEFQPGPQDLPGDLAQVAELIETRVPGKGVALTIMIAMHFRSTAIFCHNIDNIYRGARDRYIRHMKDDGVSTREIARIVGLGERRVWDILGEPDEVAGKADSGQMSLF